MRAVETGFTKEWWGWRKVREVCLLMCWWEREGKGLFVVEWRVAWRGVGVGLDSTRLDLPGHGKGRDDLVADGDGLDFAAGLDDGTDKLVAHDETRRGGLVAAVDVQFPRVVVKLYRLVDDDKHIQGRRLTSRIAPWNGP